MNAMILTNATIFDGSGAAPRTGDLHVKDGVIADDAGADATRIDCTGKWIMPGFIDIQTHYDAEVLLAPALTESLRHGVTTCVMGSCSISMIHADAEDASDIFTRVESIPR